MLAMSKVGQQAYSKSRNPEYTFTAATEPFSLGELAAPILIFGDIDVGTVNKDMVVWFFGKSYPDRQLVNWQLTCYRK